MDFVSINRFLFFDDCVDCDDVGPKQLLQQNLSKNSKIGLLQKVYDRANDFMSKVYTALIPEESQNHSGQSKDIRRGYGVVSKTLSVAEGSRRAAALRGQGPAISSKLGPI